ncbi:MAG: MBOAT family O-acyltransferase [Lachnospiraceae bacterium]|nr:MBOAT family O-acyltransferase [Lachnospiraceae bacterium]
MIFSTYRFIFYFLPITFFVYFLLNRFKCYSLSKIWLVVCSLYFYAQGSPSFFVFFLASITGNYICGTTMVRMEGNQTYQKKLLLAIGLLGNVALLGYYKYTDFFIENFNLLTGSDVALKRIVLPIGISFFTFQLIAFLVDCYRGETKEYNFISYLLFITFFPQLIVGPIIHHAEVVPQFEDERNLKIRPENLALGLFLFSIGCAKKIVLADPLTTDAQKFFNNLPANITMIQSWFHSIEYTVSYYFDLSGYADMAIGLGYMFNIAIPHNFDSPYKARNFQDYWRRWHMTLSRFLSAYIFKSVYKKGDKYRNYYVATMVTFLVSGFWHGAGWTFVVWGIINGLLVCIASWMKRKGYKFPFLLAFTLTAIGVVMVRVLFVSNTFAGAWAVYKGMFNFASLGGSFGVFLHKLYKFFRWRKSYALYLVVGLFICWFMPNSKALAEKFKPNARTMLFASILMMLSIVNMNKVVQFLYFQF